MSTTLMAISVYHMDCQKLTSHIQKRNRDCHERVGSGVGAAVGVPELAGSAVATVASTSVLASAAATAEVAAAAFSSSVTVAAMSSSMLILMLILKLVGSREYVAKQLVPYTRSALS